MSNESGGTLIVNSRYFHVSLQDDRLSVVSIRNEFVPKCAWWLIKEYGLKKENKSTQFTSLVMDDDGLSLVCDPSCVSTLKYLIRPEEFTTSPQLWRALIINVTGTAVEFPGAVYFLANALSREELSILHISTFESEVFLIQDSDVEKATSILRDTENRHSISEMLTHTYGESPEEASERIDGDGDGKPNTVEESSSNNGTPRNRDNHGTTAVVSGNSGNNLEEENNMEDQVNLDLSWIAPTVNVKQSDHSSSSQSSTSNSALRHTKDGLHLSVLPNHVILARLNPEADLSECADILTEMLLFDKRFSPLERLLEIRRKDSDSLRNEIDFSSSMADVDVAADVEASLRVEESDMFMWGLWSYDDELTILMEESDINRFPPNALITSPQHWRVIKLCGRPIAFDETGIVSSMSKIETNIPSLQISTATTNCTLVPEELLDSTLVSLAEVLKCSFRGV